MVHYGEGKELTHSPLIEQKNNLRNNLKITLK